MGTLLSPRQELKQLYRGWPAKDTVRFKYYKSQNLDSQVGCLGHPQHLSLQNITHIQWAVWSPTTPFTFTTILYATILDIF